METAQAFQFVIATMQADTPLMLAASGGIWQGFADTDLTAPFALVTQQAGEDVLTVNAYRVISRLLFQIKAIGPASGYATLITIADRIDALFRRVETTALDPGTLLAMYREQPLAYEEIVNGRIWSHLGGLYRIELQGS